VRKLLAVFFLTKTNIKLTQDNYYTDIYTHSVIDLIESEWSNAQGLLKNATTPLKK